jgi:aryl-alcohol dehydrogenase-like predicted oxidoreductase
MEFSPLGTTDISVSRVCLGTMTWGERNTQEEAFEQMDYALQAGVNFFDTAELYAVPPRAQTYGKTEEIIGNWFQVRGERSKVVLATKVAGPSFPWIRSGNKLDRTNILAAADASLKRLKTDYIDLYQLHWPMRQFPHFGRNHAGMIRFSKDNTTEITENCLEILETLNELVKSGRVRYVGLSDDSAWGIMKYLQLAEGTDLPRMQSIQNEFSLLNRSDDPYVAEVCVREQVSYLPWSPLATGLLTGKYQSGLPENSRWALEKSLGVGISSSRGTARSHAAVAGYVEVAAQAALDPTQMALKFCDQQDFVTSTIIGATNVEQLKHDIAAFDLKLDEQTMREIDRIYRDHPIPY